MTTSHVAGNVCIYLSIYLSIYPIYLCIYLAACSVCRLNVPENTPIQSITRSARAHWQLTPILDMLGFEASRIDSRSLGNSWHRDFAALTESVYKLEFLPVALYDADDQKATTCTARRVTSYEMLPR